MPNPPNWAKLKPGVSLTLDKSRGQRQATYTPFGGVHTSAGNLPANRFPGQWFQSESGLHQNWMRDYDPTTGRYLEADPLGLVDGASVYGYVGQSPGGGIDPKGEEKRPYELPTNPSMLGPDWIPMPTSTSGNLYKCACSSDEYLRFDPFDAGGNPSPHWHYYPSGKLNKKGQYSTAEHGPHLPAGTIIMIEDCSSSGSGLLYVLGGAVVIIGLFTGATEVGVVVGGVVAVAAP